jgi:hypothetical protein
MVFIANHRRNYQILRLLYRECQCLRSYDWRRPSQPIMDNLVGCLVFNEGSVNVLDIVIGGGPHSQSLITLSNVSSSMKEVSISRIM